MEGMESKKKNIIARLPPRRADNVVEGQEDFVCMLSRTLAPSLAARVSRQYCSCGAQGSSVRRVLTQMKEIMTTLSTEYTLYSRWSILLCALQSPRLRFILVCTQCVCVPLHTHTRSKWKICAPQLIHTFIKVFMMWLRGAGEMSRNMSMSEHMCAECMHTQTTPSHHPVKVRFVR